MSPRVVVPLLNVLADLHAWGRRDGVWWALVSWAMYGNTPTGNGWLYLSAWVPASGLVRSADPGQQVLYATVERFELPADGTVWPAPAAALGRTWHHYGQITRRPPAPDEISAIPISRRRSRRTGLPPPYCAPDLSAQNGTAGTPPPPPP